MPNATLPVPLLHPRHTVLILRLTLEQQHALYQGMVIAPDGQILGKFCDWPELVALLEQWLTTKPTASSV